MTVKKSREMTPTEETVDAALDYLERSTGLRFAGTRRIDGVRAVREAHRASGAPREYLAELEASRTVRQELVEHSTVHESYFFRDPEQLDFVRTEILSLARYRPIRLLSAGSSRGEEAYTLAILATEANVADNVEIIGIDISREAVETSRLGRFRDWSLRALDESRRKNYFCDDDRDNVLVPQIRSMVEFRCANLLGDPVGSGYTAILCRNVLIHLSERASRRVVSRLVDTLEPGGVFVPGASDPRYAGELPEIETFVEPRGVFHRKRDSSPRPQSSRTAMAAPDAAAQEPFASNFALPKESALRTTPQGRATDEMADRRSPNRNVVSSSRTTEHEPDLVTQVLRLAEGIGAQRARAAIDAAVVASPLDPGLRIASAVIRLDLHDQGGAAEELKRAIYLDAGLVIPHYLLGLVQFRAGRTEQGERHLRNARARLQKLPSNAVVPFAAGHSVQDLIEALEQQVPQSMVKTGKGR